MAIKLVFLKRSVRMEQNGSILSEVLRQPGPTHSVFDFLAAAVKILSPGNHVGMLGFAGGGVVAPLRAMEGAHAVHAVDLSDEGYGLFRNLSKSWCGPVHFKKADALHWLTGHRNGFDALIEDLSVPLNNDVEKPAICWQSLPPLIHKALKPNGISITNLLPSGDLTWKALITKITAGHERVLIVHLDDFENRIIIAARQLPEAGTLSHRLREQLTAIGSHQSNRFFVRTFR